MNNNYLKFKVMKKYLLGAMLVGVAFTGCVNDVETELPVKDNLKPITFEVAKYKASSRDGESAQNEHNNLEGTTDYSTQNRFGVFAWTTEPPTTPAASDGTGATADGGHYSFMDNVQVGYVSSGYWAALAQVYYWPASENNHIDFFAYSPYAASPTGEETQNSCIPVLPPQKKHNEFKYNNYVVQEGVDLMFSDKANLQNGNVQYGHYSGVPILFRHALAKLNFRVCKTDHYTTEGTTSVEWQVILKELTISSIYNKGSETFTTTEATQKGLTEWTDDGNDGYWLPTGDMTSKTWTGDVALQKMESNQVAAFYGDAHDFYVLPQHFQGQKLTIKYTVASRVKDSNSAFTSLEEFTKHITFKKIDEDLAATNTTTNVGIGGWKIGKNITYVIQIDPRGDIIHFAPYEANWDEVNGGLADF